MATPFRRPYVSWRVVSSIGELRGCTISGTRQHAGQAIAPIPRSSGDGPVEIQRPPISVFSRSISLYNTCCTSLPTRRKARAKDTQHHKILGSRIKGSPIPPVASSLVLKIQIRAPPDQSDFPVLSRVKPDRCADCWYRETRALTTDPCLISAKFHNNCTEHQL